jgi:hypothetical protein
MVYCRCIYLLQIHILAAQKVAFGVKKYFHRPGYILRKSPKNDISRLIEIHKHLLQDIVKELPVPKRSSGRMILHEKSFWQFSNLQFNA